MSEKSASLSRNTEKQRKRERGQLKNQTILFERDTDPPLSNVSRFHGESFYARIQVETLNNDVVAT